MITYRAIDGNSKKLPWDDTLTPIAHQVLEEIFKLPLEALQEKGPKALNPEVIHVKQSRQESQYVTCCLCGRKPGGKTTTRFHHFVVNTYRGGKLITSNGYDACKDRGPCDYQRAVRT